MYKICVSRYLENVSNRPTKIDCATTELFISIFFRVSPFLLGRNQDEINSIGSRGREQDTEETPILSMGP